MSKKYKYCLVPLCKNTTVKTPEKIFISLPGNKDRRRKWLKACRRNENDISLSNKGVYVCEDHFNLEEDMDNYIKFKIMGGPKIMKPHSVPHIFDCQPDRKRTFSQPPRLTAAKRIRRQIVADAISSTQAFTEGEVVRELQNQEHTEPKISEVGVIEEVAGGSSVLVAVKKKDVSIQAHPKVRSKCLQCNIRSGVTVALSPLKQSTYDVATTPTKPVPCTSSASVCSGVSEHSSVDKSSEGGSSYSVSDFSEEYQLSSSERKELESEQKVDIQRLFLKCTMQKLQRRPRLYLGLPEFAYYVFQLLEKYSGLESRYIFLTLKKIRTGHSFSILGDDFGTTEVHASRMFSKSLPVISKFLRKCIISPSVNQIKANLPLAFRARYSNVFCIIDCLEIEIEKPSDAIKQSLTWSDYKKCNTLKYLIACTPDGIINFISTGFGGRASDAVIVEHSGFLNILPENVAIMADRGFKHIEHLLVSKNCILVRPPSVSGTVKSSKDEVFETKRIASLRIHVERVIRRIREFSSLAPHACIDIKLLPHTDQIIKIVCGLINLQSGIISGKQ
ncbi:uncharacterized protein LOC126746837 [Anthonomus grandis grandis]|uniref:uncharacterized protein LOC126746837 n=1 Tax=Anthonomus grandis grandis TaxID=2921223 RepID=UPI00216563B4|nr:uncharacterized protein LOC126746837 [Anthonomus grandis grandis]